MDLARPAARAGRRRATAPLRWTCAATAARTRRPTATTRSRSPQDVSGVVKALGDRERGARRPRLGRVRRLGDRRAARRARSSALCAVVGAAPARRCCSCCVPAAGVGALRHVLAMQVPLLPERRLADPGSGFARATTSARWSAPASAFPDDADVATYQRAMRAVARRRTARWSTTAGCSAPGCAPTAGASPGAMRPAGRPAGAAGHRRATTRPCPRRPWRGPAQRRRRPYTERTYAGRRALPARGGPGRLQRAAARLAGRAAARRLGAVAGVDVGCRGSSPLAAASRDLVGGQRVAGVAVGHRRGEDHAEHAGRPRRPAGRRSCPGGPARAASRPRARRCPSP